MPEPAAPAIDLGPEWMVTEMPPGYQNRLREIQMLMADLESMGRFGRLLTATGGSLVDLVRAVFGTLSFETSMVEGETTFAVGLPGRGRLLVHVSDEDAVVQKKSPDIARVFQLLHEVADERDHVVLLTNTEPTTRPAGRGQAVTADASAFLARLGVSHMTAPTLFALWKLSLQETERAREQVTRLHAHEGGTFDLPAYARV